MKCRMHSVKSRIIFPVTHEYFSVFNSFRHNISNSYTRKVYYLMRCNNDTSLNIGQVVIACLPKIFAATLSSLLSDF